MPQRKSIEQKSPAGVETWKKNFPYVWSFFLYFLLLCAAVLYIKLSVSLTINLLFTIFPSKSPIIQSCAWACRLLVSRLHAAILPILPYAHTTVCGFRSASKSKPYSAGQYGGMETAASVGGWTTSFLISIYVHVRRINGAITRSGGTYWPRTFYSTLVVLQSSFFFVVFGSSKHWGRLRHTLSNLPHAKTRTKCAMAHQVVGMVRFGCDVPCKIVQTFKCLVLGGVCPGLFVTYSLFA